MLLADLADRLRNALQGLGRIVGDALNADDLQRDIFRRLGGLVGKNFHLRRDHRETLAGIAGARGLDGRVQRQQIGLARDLIDERHDIADLLRRRDEARDQLVGSLRLFDRNIGDAARSVTCRLISFTETDSFSVAEATLEDWLVTSSAVVERLCEVACISVEAEATDDDIPFKFSASPSFSFLRFVRSVANLTTLQSFPLRS